MQQWKWVSVTLMLGVLAWGCGDDSDSDAPGPGAVQPGPAMTPEPAPGPVTPDPGPPAAPAAPGPAAPAAPQPVPCGATMCTPPSNPLAMFGGAAGGLIPTPVACCVDATAGTCGVAMSEGAACSALAQPDTRCPSIDLGMFAAFAGNLGFGCCTDTNQCGIDGSLFGSGCVENSMAGQMLGAAGGFLMIPAAQACDAPPPGDAGMGDAGLDAGMGDAGF